MPPHSTTPTTRQVTTCTDECSTCAATVIRVVTAFADGANIVQVAYNPQTGCLAVWANDTSSFPGYDVADMLPSAVSAQRAGIPLPDGYTPPTAPRPLPVVATCQAPADPGFRCDHTSDTRRCASCASARRPTTVLA